MADTEQTRELAVIRDTLVAAHQNHGHVFVGIGLARAILASDWLLARDERIRADEREKLAAEQPAGWGESAAGALERLAGEVEAQ